MKHPSHSEPETRNQNSEAHFGEFTTNSAQETFELACRIGEHLRGGEIFLLKGELGAGKTVFAKGLAAGLGIGPADVTSPSFTLINVHEGRIRFYHIDLYRLDSGVNSDLGLDEIFESGGVVTAVEWPERLPISPAGAINVTIQYVSDSDRRIVIE